MAGTIYSHRCAIDIIGRVHDPGGGEGARPRRRPGEGRMSTPSNPFGSTSAPGEQSRLGETAGGATGGTDAPAPRSGMADISEIQTDLLPERQWDKSDVLTDKLPPRPRDIAELETGQMPERPPDIT